VLVGWDFCLSDVGDIAGLVLRSFSHTWSVGLLWSFLSHMYMVLQSTVLSFLNPPPPNRLRDPAGSQFHHVHVASLWPWLSPQSLMTFSLHLPISNPEFNNTIVSAFSSCCLFWYFLSIQKYLSCIGYGYGF
jgi:hypothetical protein